MAGHRRLLTLVLTVVLGASACVLPVPGPGQPVPTIQASIDVDTAAATVSVAVTVQDLAPDFVQVWPDGFAGPAGPRDTQAPWVVTFDAGDLAPGPHRLTVLAAGGGAVVALPFDYQLVGCNGAVSLCTRPFDEVRTVTTHNAMSSAADGWIGPNHDLDVPAQLASGVRALMLDTHRAGDINLLGTPQVPGVDPDAAYLCHTICALGQQPLDEGLGEIKVFLDQHPGAVVTLIIESYLNHDLTAAAFVSSGLDAYTFTPVPGHPWPTLGELVESGERLIVTQDRPVDPTHPWLLDVWAEAFETHFDNGAPEDFSCAPNRGSPANDLFILNHFLTDVFGHPDLADQVNHDPLLTSRIVECEAAHATVANFIAVDYSDIGNVHAAVDALNGL